MKKRYSLPLVFALFTMVTIPAIKYFDVQISQTKAENNSSSNLVNNGDFESDVNGWNINSILGHYEVQDTISMSGNALKLFGSSPNYFQYSLNLTNGYIYSFEYDINVTNASNDLKWSTFFTYGTKWMDYSTTIVSEVTNGWTHINTLLTISADSNSVNTTFGFKYYSGSGTVYLDNVSIYQLEKEADVGYNFDFEKESPSHLPLNWSFSGDGFILTQSVIKPSTTTGDIALRMSHGVSEDPGLLVSKDIPVMGRRIYNVSYYCKVTGDYSADEYLQIAQFTSTGEPAYDYAFDANNGNDYYRSKSNSGNFISPAWQYHVYGESEWRKVSFCFQTSEDANYINLRFILMGRNSISYIDDISFGEAAIKANGEYDDNSDFETINSDNSPTNWHLSSSRSYRSLLTTSTSRFYRGNRSLYLENESTIEKTLLENSARIKVDSGDIYEISAQFSSKNCDPNVKVSLNLVYYDECGVRYNEWGDKVFGYGFKTVGNCSSNESDWTPLYTRVAIPNGITHVSYYFEITSGHSNIYFDDVQLIKVEETLKLDSPKLEFHADFDSIDDKGNISGFALNSYENASFVLGQDGAELFVNFGNNSKITRNIYSFITGYQYEVKFGFNTSTSGYLRFDFFDINANLLEGVSFEKSFDQSNDGIDFFFDAPSSAYARVTIGLNTPGVLHLNSLATYMTRLPPSKGEWLGKWIWYQEDATKNIETYRYFRYTFELEDAAIYAPLQITVDDKYVLYVNDNFIDFNWDAGADSWANVHTYQLENYLVKGKNVIALKCYNLVSEAGLLFDGRFTLANGKTFNCLSSQNVLTTIKGSDMEDVDVGKEDTSSAPNWAKLDYDDSSWFNAKECGTPPCSPWGPVYYDSSLYVSNSLDIISIKAPKKVEAGKTLSMTIVLQTHKAISSTFGLTVGIVEAGSGEEEKSVQKSNLTIVSDNSDMTKWPVDKDIEITVELKVSSLIDTGTKGRKKYDLRLESNLVSLENEYIGDLRVIDSRFVSFTIISSTTQDNELISTVEDYNGAPTLMINGQPYSPSLYLRPDLNVYRQTDAEDRITNSTYELYITYQGCLGKNGQDILYKEDGTLDYEAFDDAIISLLNASVDGYVMVNFGMFAPTWWKNAHPSEVSYSQDADGKLIKGEGVSFSSELWTNTANEQLGKLIDHMKEQKYYSRVFGLRVTAGETYEFLNYGASAIRMPDYSECAKEGFKKYIEELYQSEDKLREAYHDDTLTFDTIDLPTFLERGEGHYQTLLSPSQDRFIIDYNNYLGTKSADSCLAYAKTCKEKTENKKIVGCYYGYMWVFGSYDGIAKSHAAVERVLSSDYIDFIASPLNYNERILGMSSTFMAMTDTIQAYGKLSLLEMDNRTYMSTSYSGVGWDGDWAYQVGQYQTPSESLYQLKRDYVNCFVNGVGYWNYDMYGGWLDDNQIYSLMSQMKAIYDDSYRLTDRNFNNDVAVFFSDNTYAYYNCDDEYNSPYILNSTLLQGQRENLNRMGVGYDQYNLSTLATGKVDNHKVNIFISTVEVDTEMMNHIHSYLKASGGTAIWIYACGWSNGSSNCDSLTNMKELTGFNLGINTLPSNNVTSYVEPRYSLQVEINGGNSVYTSGLEGIRYGTLNKFIDPQIYIDDSEATILGYLTDGGQAGLGVKQMDGYKSIYSAGPNLPVKFLKNVLSDAGVHMYSDNLNDVIYSNKNYVAVHSNISEMKVIYLQDNCAVYDCFEEKYISKNTSVIAYYHTAGDTKLFRIDPIGGIDNSKKEPVKEELYNKTEFILTTIGIVAIIGGIISGKVFIPKIIKRRSER